MTKYTDYANTKSEAKEKASALLRQLYSGDSVETVSYEAKGKSGDFLFYTVSLKTRKGDFTPDEAVRVFPTVFVTMLKKETSEELGSYRLYLLSDFDKLPYYVKQLTDVTVLLAYVSPLQKPEKSLSVDDVHTARGRQALEDYFDYGDSDRAKHLEDVALFRDAPKELKLYALFDNFGEMTLEEIKEELESGEYEGGEKDGERILSELTGETYETSEKYLSALSELCGAGVVKKYKKRLLEGYNFYSVEAYVRYLEYIIRETEDYTLVQAQEPELAKKYKYREELTAGATRSEGATALDIALCHYLKDYIDFRPVYDGLSSSRIADYCRIPAEKMREAETKLCTKNSLL